MANEKHLKLLRMGVGNWNGWRLTYPEIDLDLDSADLEGANLDGANLKGVSLRKANLQNADLSHAECRRTNLNGANLRAAKLIGADMKGAYLNGADLVGAELTEAQLIGVKLNDAELSDADLTRVVMGWASLGGLDLSKVKGLTTVQHAAPSTIGIDTLYKSGGQIPVEFLRGCGVPDDFIAFLPSLISAEHPIEFYSCFISYSHKDEEFAGQLCSQMREAHLRVWYAPKDLKGGEKLYEQIDRAIQIYDKLVIVLSEDSMRSNWVMTEIRKSLKAEVKEGRRKLFPIRLVDYGALSKWESFDSDTGKDLAVEVREYFIPDFSNWKDHNAFELAFGRLLEDLRAAEKHVDERR